MLKWWAFFLVAVSLFFLSAGSKHFFIENKRKTKSLVQEAGTLIEHHG